MSRSAHALCQLPNLPLALLARSAVGQISLLAAVLNDLFPLGHCTFTYNLQMHKTNDKGSVPPTYERFGCAHEICARVIRARKLHAREIRSSRAVNAHARMDLTPFGPHPEGDPHPRFRRRVKRNSARRVHSPKSTSSRSEPQYLDYRFAVTPAYFHQQPHSCCTHIEVD